MNRSRYSDLQQLPNIGPAMDADLRLLGIQCPSELVCQDPYAMYDALCRRTGHRQDPCVLDVFIAAVRFMGGDRARPWWAYTAERKATLAGRRGRHAPRVPGLRRRLTTARMGRGGRSEGAPIVRRESRRSTV